MKVHIFLSILIFILVLVATASGLFYQTPGSPIEYTTVRGELAVYTGSGLYRFDPAWLAREGAVWDAINLFVGLPLFALAIYLSQKNSLRGRLLLGGMLFYFYYVYIMAMAGYAFNRMFLVYTTIFALSGVAFFINLHAIDVTRLPEKISPRFPRGLFIGFTFAMSFLLILLWLGRIVPIIIDGQFPEDMTGLNTLVSQGFDLGMIVPLLLSTGILLWRHSAWGYLLTGVSLSYSLLMCITLPAFIAVPMLQDGKIKPLEASPFLILCLLGLILAGLFYKNV